MRKLHLNDRKINENQNLSGRSRFRVRGLPGVENGVEHRFVEQAVAHPLGDDDVYLLDRQNDLLHFSLDDGDLVPQPIGADYLLGGFHNARHVHAVNVGSPGLGGEHGEDPSSASNVQDNLVL